MVIRLIFLMSIIIALSVSNGCGSSKSDSHQEAKLENEVGENLRREEIDTSLQDQAEEAAQESENRDAYGAYSYISPSDFPGLPIKIAEWLERGGYLIPQAISPIAYENSPELKYHNVITGEFTKSGQKDVAVYCTALDSAAIFVFQNGNINKIDSIKTDVGSDDPLSCCYLIIETATPEDVMQEVIVSGKYDLSFDTSFQHDGISIGADEIYFCTYYKIDTRWIKLVDTDSDC